MEEILEEALEQTVPEEVQPLDEELPAPVVEEAMEEPVDEPAEPNLQLEAVATILATYGGSGNVDTVETELESVLEGLLEAHATEVEQSRKVGMLTFALSNLVHDTGAVLALVDVDAVDFDPTNIALLRDFLEPIYQEKPYLFKVISPLRGANIATGITGNTLPTNRELGALSMEEYTAYRNARGSASR